MLDLVYIIVGSPFNLLLIFKAGALQNNADFSVGHG